MKKFICFTMLLLIILFTCVSANAKEWYEGGTLHNSTIESWKKASSENKLATCGDFLASMWMNKKLNLNIASMNVLKSYAKELVDFIDSATEGNDDVVNNSTVSEFAAMGVIMMGWGK